MAVWRYKCLLSSSIIVQSFAALTREIFFQHSKRSFVSPSGRVISSIHVMVPQLNADIPLRVNRKKGSW